MAIATQMTVETGSMVEEHGGNRHVRLSVTYNLEREDGDITVVAARIGAELEKAQYRVWQAMEYQKETPAPAPLPSDPASQTVNGRNGSGIATSSNGRGSNSQQPTPIEPASQFAELATSPQKIALRSLATRARRTEVDLNQLAAQRFGKRTVNELTKQEASTLMQSLQQGDWGVPHPAQV